MPRYARVEKAIGETPLAALERFRLAEGIPNDVPLAYAGRLDPLAHGTLIVLIGDECKRQAAYHALDKAYDFEVLLQFATDTGDVLGLATYDEKRADLSPARIKSAVEQYIGIRHVPYPHFSSKPVDGKPLFLWTLEGRLDEIVIPTTAATVYSLEHRETTVLSRSALCDRISALVDSIPPVHGESKALGNDFRRPLIRARWATLFAQVPPDVQYAVLRMRAVVAGGTYIRTLAPALAEALGTSGLALDIHRTAVGRYRQLALPLIGTLGWWQSRL